MDKKELLTIKEFADNLGVTQQAIYKQLNNKLQTYVVVLNNRKMLVKSALNEVYGIDDEQSYIKLNNNNNSTEKLIDILKQEIDAKNLEILKLQELLYQEQQLRISELEKAPESEEKGADDPKKKHWWK